MYLFLLVKLVLGSLVKEHNVFTTVRVERQNTYTYPKVRPLCTKTSVDISTCHQMNGGGTTGWQRKCKHAIQSSSRPEFLFLFFCDALWDKCYVNKVLIDWMIDETSVSSVSKNNSLHGLLCTTNLPLPRCESGTTVLLTVEKEGRNKSKWKCERVGLLLTDLSQHLLCTKTKPALNFLSCWIWGAGEQAQRIRWTLITYIFCADLLDILKNADRSN